MSRDFLLVFAGGMVSLVTTLVVLFVADFIRQRTETLKAQKIKSMPNPESNALKRSEFFKRGAAEAEKKADAPAVEAAKKDDSGTARVFESDN
jgi:hypothetical protein